MLITVPFNLQQHHTEDNPNRLSGNLPKGYLKAIHVRVLTGLPQNVSLVVLCHGMAVYRTAPKTGLGDDRLVQLLTESVPLPQVDNPCVLMGFNRKPDGLTRLSVEFTLQIDPEKG